MSHFAVLREAGPEWTDGKGAFEQLSVEDHTAFMNALANEGFVLSAGPLSGTEQGRIRVLLIVDAADEGEIQRRLADDPWALSQRLVTVTIEPWNVIVGAERFTSSRTAQQ